MRVTEKGQVTIPKEIRDRLGIVPGSEVEFIAKGRCSPFGEGQRKQLTDSQLRGMGCQRRGTAGPRWHDDG